MALKFLSNKFDNRGRIKTSDKNDLTPFYIKKIKIEEKIFNLILKFSGIIILMILSGIIISLLMLSLPSIKKFGFNFFIISEWNPVKGVYGALSFLIGTMLTSFIALIISIPFSFSISILLGEYFTRGWISSFFKSVTELLAGIPSVIYGFWGFFILVPIIGILKLKLGLEPFGVGIFTSSIILSIMILPYSASIGREVIELVPNDLKEAAYSLGATRFEVIRRIVFPYAGSGFLAGLILSLGRALGETMAVTMLIGNFNGIPKNIFSSGNTIASIIALSFAESSDIQLSALIELGLILLIISLIINLIGKFIVKKFKVRQ